MLNYFLRLGWYKPSRKKKKIIRKPIRGNESEEPEIEEIEETESRKPKRKPNEDIKEDDNDQRCYKMIRKITPVVEVEEEIETKKEKIDFTSEQSWIKELDTWNESKVMGLFK